MKTGMNEKHYDVLKRSVNEVKQSVDEYNRLKDIKGYIAQWEEDFDTAVERFCYDPTVKELIEEMKGKYKERLLTEDASRRAKPEK